MSRASEIFERVLAGGFGQIERMIEAGEAEELFLDYKRSADNGDGRNLHNNDRANLAKAISGFGNSEGGVIIWGVDCRSDPERGDIPSGAHLIRNPARFRSWLEQITTGLTVPAHDGVRHEAILSEEQPAGFVVSFIPKGAYVPYQTVRDLRYYMRAGSNFTPVPHGVLAGMFGRQPQPNVFATFIAEQNNRQDDPAFIYTFGIGLHNKGPGIAEDAYVNLHVIDIGGRNNRIMIQQDPGARWSHSNFTRLTWNSMMMRDYRLAPDATVTPMIVTIEIRPPFQRTFRVKISCGANRAVPYRGEWIVPPDEMEQHFHAVSVSEPAEFREACRTFGDRLLQILPWGSHP